MTLNPSLVYNVLLKFVDPAELFWFEASDILI